MPPLAPALGSRYAALAPESAAPSVARPSDAVPSPAAHRRAQRSNNRRNQRMARVIVVSTVAETRSAVRELKKHAQIGVDCEGVALSRTGALELVQASCPSGVYIFDVSGAEGKKMFEEGGLRELLERKEIVKVAHDCRHDSDALWHQHNVRLWPVLDTQVAFGEWRAIKGHGRGLPVGLRAILKRFAGLTDDELGVKSAVKGSMQTDELYWKKRPLTKEMIEYAAIDVGHIVRAASNIRKAVEAVNKKAWERVEKGSAEYVAAFRDDPDGRGPERAARFYELMARQVAIERIHADSAREEEILRQTDPCRNFELDMDKVVAKMLSISMEEVQEEAERKAIIKKDEAERTEEDIRSEMLEMEKKEELELEEETKKFTEAITAAYNIESAKALAESRKSASDGYQKTEG